MKDKLAIGIRVVNFVKASATNTKLFNHLCKEMDSAYETLLFHTAVRWLSKGNKLGRVYDLRHFGATKSAQVGIGAGQNPRRKK